MAPAVSAFVPTIPNTAPPPGPAPEGMVWVPGGEFSMGSVDPRATLYGGPDAMADARPVHRVYVDGFWMDATEVTNEQFEHFVQATGYVTIAERVPTSTATVTRVAQWLRHGTGGYRIALDRTRRRRSRTP